MIISKLFVGLIWVSGRIGIAGMTHPADHGEGGVAGWGAIRTLKVFHRYWASVGTWDNTVGRVRRGGIVAPIMGLFQIIHLVGLFFKSDLLRARASSIPARHLREGVLVALLHIEFGILWRCCDSGARSDHRGKRLHGGLGAVPLVRRDVRFVEIFVFGSSRRVTATTAVTAALEA